MYVCASSLTVFWFFALQWAACSNLEKEHIEEYIIIVAVMKSCFPVRTGCFHPRFTLCSLYTLTH